MQSAIELLPFLRSAGLPVRHHKRDRPDPYVRADRHALPAVHRPTVYRHFPDRDALLSGIAARLGVMSGSDERTEKMETLDDFGPMMVAMSISYASFPLRGLPLQKLSAVSAES